jgi:hypothetical protein
VVRFNGTANRCREEVERIKLGCREHPEEYEQMGLLLRFPSRKPGEKHQRDTTTPLRPARPAYQTGRRIARQSPQDKQLRLVGLVRLALEIVVPGVSILVAQMLFSVVDIAYQSAVSGTTPTGDYGTGSTKGKYLAAVALKSDMSLLPMVDPAEGDLEGLVVRFDALDNLGHLLVPSGRLTRPDAKPDGNHGGAHDLYALFFTKT